MAKPTNMQDINDLSASDRSASALGDAAQQVKEQAKSLAGEAREQTVKAAGQARNHVQGLVDRQKDQAADRLGSLAEALHEAAHKLQEKDQGAGLGGYAVQAAQKVERLSSYLRDNDLRGVVRDTESFARQRPELFLGGTFLVGLMLARFLKSSALESSAGSYSPGYRPSYASERRGPDLGTSTGVGTPSYNTPPGV